MTKEKAIMELMTNAKQIEALESCIKILEGWSTLDDLTAPLKKRMEKIEGEKNHLRAARCPLLHCQITSHHSSGKHYRYLPLPCFDNSCRRYSIIQ